MGKIDMKNIENQIKSTYHKAFFDLLEERVRSEPPDYEWIVRLYKEVRDKLAALLRKESELRKEIEERMDIVIFDQMIRNDAFDGADAFKLICYVFDKCRQLGSPARDKDTENKKNEIVELMNSGGVFATILPLFIRNAHYCIDHIYCDLRSLMAGAASASGQL